MQGQLSGWAGIGLGPTHSAMDTYVGWILSSGTAVLQDGYSSSFDIPITDPVQSTRMISASQTGNYFRMTFERSLNTGDSRDVQIISGQPLLFNWAYHLEVNPNTLNKDVYYAQHTNRGRQNIVIQVPTSAPSNPRPSPSANPRPSTNPRPNPSPRPSISNPILTSPSPTPVPSQEPPVEQHQNQTILDTSFIRGDDNFYASWRIVGQDLYVTYDCVSAGWVGIGFDRTSRIHRSTDTYISWILSSGTGVVQDGYSSSETQPEPDKNPSAVVLNASLIQNQFKLTFKRPIQTFDDQDIPITQDWITLGWAYHPTANPNTANVSQAIIPIHTHRGAVSANLYLGSIKPQEEYILPSTYYMIMCCSLFVLYILYLRIKDIHHKHSHNAYYKGSQQESYTDSIQGQDKYSRYSPIETQSTQSTQSISFKDRCWTWLYSRVSGIDISRADLLFGLGILLLNGVAVGIGVLLEFSQSEIWGYLSTANSLLVAIPATRNSFLVWISGISINQTIMYHRWLGRLTILEAFLHFCYSVDQFSLFKESSIYGTIALTSLGVLGATSIEWIRRKQFNTFFYSHHIFLIYYIFGSLHSKLFFIYSCIAIGIYTIDRMIRLFRGIFPQQIISVNHLNHQVVKIRFPKYKYRGRQKVGQYVFLNFPQLSLLEWHPFTLADGPDELYHEVYIKNLGDYTNRLVERLNNKPEALWIRVDGFYGNWLFDYHSYLHIVLICGGVGITPALSLIRHVYDYNISDINDSRESKPKSNLEHIYLVWCCTTEEDAQWVNHELLHAIQQSYLEYYPKFDLFIFITGSQGRLRNSTFHVGRPNLNAIFDTVEEHMIFTESYPIKSCVYVSGPKSLSMETWDTWSKRTLSKRYDFYQEIFEF
jgi:predicted ferric reductase